VNFEVLSLNQTDPSPPAHLRQTNFSIIGSELVWSYRLGNICRTAHIHCLKKARVRIVHAVDPDPDSRSFATSQFPDLSRSQDLSELPKGINCAVVTLIIVGYPGYT
jgi:hypothetical protein